MLGGVYRYLREADSRHFQPMNANFGLVDALPQRVRGRKAKRDAMSRRAVAAMCEWRDRTFEPGTALAGASVR